MTSTSDADLTDDAFLGGRLSMLQPKTGYRAGADAVLLAAAVPAQAGDSVLELGCGVGTALLCLGRRVPGLALEGVELQADYAALAERNAARNGIAAEITCADLRHLPPALRNRSFAHVLANPPYYARERGSSAPDPGRDVALAGDTPVADWAETARRRLAPRGWFTLIQRADRLPEVLAALLPRFGSIAVLPIAGRAGRAADRVLVRAQKDGRAPFRLLPPLVMHEGDRHEGDSETYVQAISAILRDGAALDWPR